MSCNCHLRKRDGDNINSCLCNRCFSQKCYAYEITIFKIQTEYAYFKAYVEHQRGNNEKSLALQEEDHYAEFSEYARDAINGVEHEDWDVVKELQKYLLSNNFIIVSLIMGQCRYSPSFDILMLSR